MSEKLNPCPSCGKTDTVTLNAFFRFVFCLCGCRGPHCSSAYEAIDKWNALPRVLKWTDKSPTEPGLYLVRMRKSGAVFPQYVDEKDIENEFLDAFYDDWTHVAGPISLPEFDKNDG